MTQFRPSKSVIDSTTPVTIEGIALITYNLPGSVANVPDATKTTILTVNYTLGTIENIALISCSGEDYAKFYMTVNGVDIDIRRTGPSRNLEFNFTGAPFALNFGDIVDIKVEHFNTGSLVDFDATLYGYT